MIHSNILSVIGQTPTVKINHLAQGLACEVYAKCEFLNPGGSVKDRIGYAMVEAAERAGQIKPGDTLIEPTSGNTGIGIALAAAVKGYSVVITMPTKMSREKQVILERLGATIYRTPADVSSDHPDSHLSLAKKLCQELPNAYMLDQYTNPNNPKAHYEGTAEEIIADFGQDLHMIVAGVGTGGTLSGIAKRFKTFNPAVKIVGVDPVGSILGGGTEIEPYLMEGIGYDFCPETLDNALIDAYVKIKDKDAFLMARRLIKEEGLLVGGSAGAAMWAALEAAKSLSAGQKCLVVLPDSIRNYMSKFGDDAWMQDNGFL